MHDQGFDRLVRMVDRLATVMPQQFFGQIGSGIYEPINFPWVRFLDERSISHFFDVAEIVIAHDGAGTLLECVKRGKRVIIVPREKRFHEVRYDNKMDLAHRLSKQRPLTKMARNFCELSQAASDLLFVGSLEGSAVSSSSRLCEEISRIVRGIHKGGR